MVEPSEVNAWCVEKVIQMALAGTITRDLPSPSTVTSLTLAGNATPFGKHTALGFRWQCI
jgi:hypothetical protein